MKIIAAVIIIAQIRLMISSASIEQDIHEKILAPFMNGPVEKLFSAYNLVYKKNYTVDSVEGVHRLKAFRANMKYIHEENQKGHSYKLGVGPFTDMSNEEYKEKVLPSHDLFSMPMQEEDNSFSDFLPRNNRGAFFFNDITSFLPPVRSHLPTSPNFCKNAQTILSFIDAVAAGYSKKFGKSLNWSPQQYLDCNSNNFTCNSTLESNSGPLIRIYNYYFGSGVALESAFPSAPIAKDKLYPFDGKKDTCKASGKFLPKIMNSYRLINDPSRGCPDFRTEDFLKNGPIVSLFDATSPAFQNYKEGILTAELVYPACQKNLNYRMAIVAVGLVEPNKYFLKVRNSWGTGWGEQGYMRILKKDTRTCDTTCTAVSFGLKEMPKA